MADHSINSNKPLQVTIRYRAVQSHETIFTIFTYWISNPKPHKKDNDRDLCGMFTTITGNPIIICSYLHCQIPHKYIQTSLKEQRYI